MDFSSVLEIDSEINRITGPLQGEVEPHARDANTEKSVFVLKHDDCMKYSDNYRTFMEKYPHTIMLPALTTDDGSPISNVLNLSNPNPDITKDPKLVNPPFGSWVKKTNASNSQVLTSLTACHI